MPDEVKLTQTMVMHAFGSKWSKLNYEILANGERTGIILAQSTDGRPHYRYTARELVDGDERLDLMQRAGPDPVEWIKGRLAARAEGGAAT